VHTPEPQAEKKPMAPGAFLSGRLVCWVLLAVIIISAAFIHYSAAFIHYEHADVPFERDEGEYAYAGQLLLEGIPPYKLAYNMKFPGIYAAYALSEAAFGMTPTGIRLALILINAGSILLVFLIAKRLLGRFEAVAAAAFFVVLSMLEPVLGLFANAEHFVLLPTLAGLFLLIKAHDSGKKSAFLFSGLLLGTAVVIKQHGLAFLAAAGLYTLLFGIMTEGRDWKRLGTRMAILSIGAALPLAAMCVLLYLAGVFDKFWFWTVAYAREYVNEIPLELGMRNLRGAAGPIIESSAPVFLLFTAGLIALFSTYFKGARAFLAIFLVFSFLSTVPGFHFREHYFILFLPAVALMAAAGAGAILRASSKVLSRRYALAICSLAVMIATGYSLYTQRAYLLELSPTRFSRLMYGSNPFPEALEAAMYIKEHTSPEDTIAVIGSEPEIYFYSHRHSATGYIYTYAMMEEQPYAERMQQEMISEIEDKKSAYIVFVRVDRSWLIRPGSNMFIFAWSEDYLSRYYDIEEMMEMTSSEETVHAFGEAAKEYTPHSNRWLAVYKRKYGV